MKTWQPFLNATLLAPALALSSTAHVAEPSQHPDPLAPVAVQKASMSQPDFMDGTWPAAGAVPMR